MLRRRIREKHICLRVLGSPRRERAVRALVRLGDQLCIVSSEPPAQFNPAQLAAITGGRDKIPVLNGITIKTGGACNLSQRLHILKSAISAASRLAKGLEAMRITRDDPEDLGMVMYCLTFEAITVEEVSEWASRAIDEESDPPVFLYTMLDLKGLLWGRTERANWFHSIS